jgi:hypothetical protein
MGAVIYIANSGAHALTVYAHEASTTINQNPSASVARDHVSIFFAVANNKWYGVAGAKA